MKTIANYFKKGIMNEYIQALERVAQDRKVQKHQYDNPL